MVRGRTEGAGARIHFLSGRRIVKRDNAALRRRRAVVLTGFGAVACFFGVAALIQYPSYRRAKRDVELEWNRRRFATVVSAELHRGDGTSHTRKGRA